MGLSAPLGFLLAGFIDGFFLRVSQRTAFINIALNTETLTLQRGQLSVGRTADNSNFVVSDEVYELGGNRVRQSAAMWWSQAVFTAGAF